MATPSTRWRRQVGARCSFRGPIGIQDGSYEFQGRRHQLPLTEPEHSNAIHGLVRWVAWHGAGARTAPRRARTCAPSPARISVLARRRDRVRVVGERPHGADECDEHRRRGVPLRKWRTSVPHAGHGADRRRPASSTCATALRTDDRGIPIGSVAVGGTDLDFRSARLSATRSWITATPTSSDTTGASPA